MKYFYQNLKHQIIFLENFSQNELEPGVWTEKITTYAEIQAASECNFENLENFNFGHVITEAYFLFKIRYQSEITNKMRIKFKERIFEIKRIINVAEKNRLMNLISLEI
jgi:SPP1 family predicted phage head-tail adaptor